MTEVIQDDLGERGAPQLGAGARRVEFKSVMAAAICLLRSLKSALRAAAAPSIEAPVTPV